VDGWTGIGLEVDLSRGVCRPAPAADALLRDYLGGRGLGVALVRARVPPSLDPLAPGSLLVFAVGPLTGTRTPCTGRHAVVAKSPLTGTLFDFNAGGRFGFQLKAAGFDYLAVTGRAARPVVLVAADGRAELREAGDLWGRNCRDTTAALAGLGRVCCIGRAGERGVRLAAITNDGAAAGRGGLGAVMGSKNLKAIVVRGSARPSVADPDLCARRAAELERMLAASPVSSKGLAAYGTPVLVNLVNAMKVMPTDNFRRVRFDDAEAVSGERIAAAYRTRRTACYTCTIGCQRRDRASGRRIPDYETLALFGPNCGNADLAAICDLNDLCDDYGLDPISVAGALACHAEIEGRRLKPDEMRDLVRRIGEREGLGAELGAGSLAYASARGHPEASMSVKGLDLPGYDPRGMLGMALSYATSNLGGCHLRAYMVGPEILGKPKLVDRRSWAGKSGLVQVLQNAFTAADCLVACKFVLFSAGEEELANLLSAVTGVDYPSEALMRVGERVWNAERLFNLAAGVAPDALPERFFTEDADGETRPIARDEFEQALRDYHAFRGWDAAGIPTPAKLAALGLEA